MSLTVDLFQPGVYSSGGPVPTCEVLNYETSHNDIKCCLKILHIPEMPPTLNCNAEVFDGAETASPGLTLGFFFAPQNFGKKMIKTNSLLQFIELLSN